MKIYLLLLCCFFKFYTDLKAQHTDTLRSLYNNQTLYRYGSYFLKGSEKLTYRELEKEFSMSDIGLEAYLQSKKYRSTATVFSILSLASGITSIAYLSNNNSNRSTALLFIGGQLAFSLGAGRLNLLSQQSLDRAIWQRNKDLLFPSR
jgi:hypothetical protein